MKHAKKQITERVEKLYVIATMIVVKGWSKEKVAEVLAEEIGEVTDLDLEVVETMRAKINGHVAAVSREGGPVEGVYRDGKLERFN